MHVHIVRYIKNIKEYEKVKNTIFQILFRNIWPAFVRCNLILTCLYIYIYCIIYRWADICQI